MTTLSRFFSGDELLISADTFSATSSRHQSAIKRAADDRGYVLVPGLGDLVNIETVEDARRYCLARKMAASEYERKIERSRSPNMRVYLEKRIEMECDACRRAIRKLPLHEAASVSAGFFRAPAVA